MNRKISSPTRIATAICALALVAIIFLPLWRIELSAPQYPEGLVMKIYADRLGGDVEIVNGLNHYIGMRTLHEKDFVEFQVLPYIFALFAAFGLAALFVRRKWFFYTWVALFLVFAATAMMDFYRWEYNYGHNLDPSAPIQVPGMSYQPPLIGFKQLLNFGAYSIPDSGGILFIGVAVLMLAFTVVEWKKGKKSSRFSAVKAAAAGLFIAVTMNGCSSGPQPITPGRDACDFCKMTITDLRFGGELVTSKGRVYKFDDLHCLLAFLEKNPGLSSSATTYVLNYDQPGQLINAGQSWLLQSATLRSPMGGNLAAFDSEAKRNEMSDSLHAERFTWAELLK